MGNNKAYTKSDKLTKFAWILFTIWFCSNLLSQVAYIAVYGLPYDGLPMLVSLGPIYYLAIIVEISMWVFIGGFFGKKIIRKENVINSTIN
jgi:hypothetical protein